MARKRSVSRARSRARFGIRTRSRGRSSGGSTDPLMGVIVPSAVYGAVRDKAGSMITGIIGTPLGEYTDEAALGFLGYLGMKNTSGFLKDMSRAALTVESASIGHMVGSPYLREMGGSSDSSNGGSFSW